MTFNELSCCTQVNPLLCPRALTNAADTVGWSSRPRRVIRPSWYTYVDQRWGSTTRLSASRLPPQSRSERACTRELQPTPNQTRAVRQPTPAL